VVDWAGDWSAFYPQATSPRARRDRACSSDHHATSCARADLFNSGRLAKNSDRPDWLSQPGLPFRSLQGQPPLTAYPQAQKTNRPFRLEWEKDALDMQRVYDFLAQGRWFRLTSSVGMFSLGAHRYNARTKLARQTLEITFDPATLEFICLPKKVRHLSA